MEKLLRASGLGVFIERANATENGYDILNL
jgi:hypothetical protein